MCWALFNVLLHAHAMLIIVPRLGFSNYSIGLGAGGSNSAAFMQGWCANPQGLQANGAYVFGLEGQAVQPCSFAN